jgi:hypothetical protein
MFPATRESWWNWLELKHHLVSIVTTFTLNIFSETFLLSRTIWYGSKKGLGPLFKINSKQGSSSCWTQWNTKSNSHSESQCPSSAHVQVRWILKSQPGLSTWILSCCALPEGTNHAWHEGWFRIKCNMLQTQSTQLASLYSQYSYSKWHLI